ncbi:hypothetical protein LPJ64_004234 [Coemansia asiatica]|uniref:Major facilitator superfamily (MFS) profile domain-containing protein n=1 Tax=Coemansia asiatica TaxID=1052880 RepID=A0A9W8CI13_9FUNG|nr:hypothetical protein LPJ64_004234 [Coemansia asiatica]
MSKPVTKVEEAVLETDESSISEKSLDRKPYVPESGPERDAIVKHLRFKLDMRLIPHLAILYLFNSLDRGNIGNARLAHLEEDTHLKGNDFYNALSFFYFGYTIAQVPTMYIFKKVTPSVLIGVTMVLWGVCSTCMAAAKDHSGLIATRFFLGIFEAGVGMGAPTIISFFYMRSELAWRQAIFYGSSTFAGAFGGLVAYGVSKNLANEHLAPWKLLFIIEGTPTIFLGIVTFFLLPNSPEKLESWFVTPQEKQVAIERARQGYNTDSSLLDKRQLIAAFTDWKNLFYCLIYIGLNIPLASYQSFLPTIIKLMGYTEAKAQLMTVPPYACALAFLLLISWNSDRTMLRGYHVCLCALVACVGYVLLISSSKLGCNYAGACLAAMGLYPIVPLMLSWVSNNNVGHTKRAISLAIMNMLGQCFATVGTQIFKNKTAPRFFMGYSICIAFTGLMMVLSLVLTFLLKRENARRQEKFGDPRPLSSSEQTEVIEKGIYDKHPGFRYFI